MTPSPLAVLRDRLVDGPPGAGATRLVGIDGFSGSGKTTLAASLVGPGVSVLSIEDFYPGWDGLAAGVDRAHARLVVPLLRSEVPVLRPWDWEHGREGPATTPDLAATVVLEGCGAGAEPLRGHQAVTVWVHADPATREQRLRARADWPLYAPHRAGFEAQERRLAQRDRTPEEADLVVEVTPDGGIRVLEGE